MAYKYILFSLLISISVAHAHIPKDLIEAIEKSSVDKVESICALESFTMSDRAILIDLSQNVITKRKSEKIGDCLSSVGLASVLLIGGYYLLNGCIKTGIKRETNSTNWAIAFFDQHMRFKMPFETEDNDPREIFKIIRANTMRSLLFYQYFPWVVSGIAASVGIGITGLVYLLHCQQSRKYNDALTIKVILQQLKVKN